MCNLYDVGPAPRNKRFGWEKDLKDLLKEITYVAPGKPGLIATIDEDEIATARAVWGFPRKFPGKGGMVARDVNNARDNKLEGRMWGKAFRERRCVIPVRRFFEWSGPKGSKTKHAITAGDDDQWFYIGGVWEPNDVAPEGRSYSMITTGAPASIQPIHDRCPLVLPDDRVEDFMRADKAPFEMVEPFEGALTITPPVG